MVTAGVFVLFRLNGLIDATPVVASTVAYVGAATALLGAFSALSQWDIKKVLAYSTVSQLGYMVMAIGVGSYVGAIFHLLTHAFFKGLLFLGAGSVIHALDGEQDMRKMGGLKKFMPYTHLGFVVGWWSLSGLPLFSGFFSKDEILYNTLFGVRGSWILWLMGLTAALMTSFYMTRLMFHVFWSPARLAEDLKPHEGGPFFTAPLMLLSFFAVVFGFLGLPHVFSKVIPGHPTHMIGDWLSPMLSTHSNIEHSILSELSMMLASVVVAGSGVVLAYLLYIRKDENVDRVVQKIKINELTKASSMALYIDHSFNHYLVRPFSDLSKAIWLFIDQILIDQTISKFAKLIAVSGEIGKTLNNGRVQHYISIFVVILSMVLVGVLFS
jgi:NADH-quinone oxidoreductase subunit L